MSSTPPIHAADSDAPARTTVGVLGGGQLGRMLALAGYPLGIRFVLVDPSPRAPAGELAQTLVADYDDATAMAALAACEVVTYEFESVPVAVASALAEKTLVCPAPAALGTAQDRLLEKQCFRALGIPTAPFAPVSTLAELERAVSELGLPAVLKTRRLGYDGKGQRVLRSPADVPAAFAELGQAPLLLEGFVHFERELSLLCVRSRSGETRFYPLVENHHREGILRRTMAPAPRVSAELAARAESFGQRLLERLDYVGVLALELFELDGELWANEMAPRVHNSGHFSIEGARTSQFENHLRAVLGWPLGDPGVPEPCAMLNLVGALPTPASVLSVPGAHLHLYGKEPRPGRKVGHITVIARSDDELRERLNALASLPGVG